MNLYSSAHIVKDIHTSNKKRQNKMWTPHPSKKESLETIAYQLKRIADFLEWLKKQTEAK